MKIWVLSENSFVLSDLEAFINKTFPGNDVLSFSSCSAVPEQLEKAIPDIVIADSHIDCIKRLRILAGYITMIILINCDSQTNCGFKVESYLWEPLDKKKLSEIIEKSMKKISSHEEYDNSHVSCLYSAFIKATAYMEPLDYIVGNMDKLRKAYFSIISQGLFKELPSILFPLIAYEPLEKEKHKYYQLVLHCLKDTYEFARPYCENLPNIKFSEIVDLDTLKNKFIELLNSFYKEEKITGYSRKCLICDIAMDIVDANLLNASLERVADIMGISPTFLSSVYSEVNQSSFKQYIVESKIKQACSLLRNCKTDIKTVVNNVGYSDVKYFRTVFKKITGMNPSEYKNQHK